MPLFKSKSFLLLLATTGLLAGGWLLWKNEAARWLAQLISSKSHPAAAELDVPATLTQLQRTFAWLHHEIGPQKAPSPVFPPPFQERLLAERAGLDIPTLHAAAQAGLTSPDPLLQAQALLITGQREAALAKFDTLLQEPQAAPARTRLAWEGKSQIADDSRQYEEALRCWEKVLELAPAALAPQDPVLSREARWWHAVHLRFNSRYRDGEKILRDLLREQEADPGTRPLEIVFTLEHLAGVLGAFGDHFEEVEALHRRQLALLEAQPDSPPYLLLKARQRLAHALRINSRQEEAEVHLLAALKDFEKIYGEDHPNLDSQYSDVARAMVQNGRLAQAEPYSRRALELAEKQAAADDSTLSFHIAQYTAILRRLNRAEEAEPLMLRMLAQEEKHWGKDGHYTADQLGKTVEYYLSIKRPASAEPHLARQISLLEKLHGENNPRLYKPLGQMVDILQALKREPEASAWIERQILNCRHYKIIVGYPSPNLEATQRRYQDSLTAQGIPPAEIATRLQTVLTRELE